MSTGPVQGEDQRRSSAQAAQGQGQGQSHEQGPNPGTAPNEHPLTPKVRPSDAGNHNDHRFATPEAARQNAGPGSGAGAGAGAGAGGRDSSASGTEYPPQKHAGKAGLGPHFYEEHRATFQDKVHGLREEVEGQITHDEKLWQVCSRGTGLENCALMFSWLFSIFKFGYVARPRAYHRRAQGEGEERGEACFP
jgi:hypothetical protein